MGLMSQLLDLHCCLFTELIAYPYQTNVIICIDFLKVLQTVLLSWGITVAQWTAVRFWNQHLDQCISTWQQTNRLHTRDFLQIIQLLVIFKHSPKVVLRYFTMLYMLYLSAYFDVYFVFLDSIYISIYKAHHIYIYIYICFISKYGIENQWRNESEQNILKCYYLLQNRLLSRGWL